MTQLNIPGVVPVKINTLIDINAFDESENTNRARAKGHDELHVKVLQNSLRHGWDESQPRPFAVQNEFGKPVLIDGHHRRDAWRRLGHTTLPVDYYKLTMGVKLEDVIRQIGLKLNDHKPVKPVTIRDLVSLTQHRIETEDLDLTVDEIKEMMLDVQLKHNIHPNAIAKGAKEIWDRKNSSEQVESIQKNQIDKYERENPQLAGPSWYPISGAGDSETYILRALTEICDNYTTTGDKVDVGLYAQQVNSMQHLWKVRQDAVDKMEALFDSIRDAAKKLKPGQYPWTDPVAFPQLDSERVSMDIVKIGRY